MTIAAAQNGKARVTRLEVEKSRAIGSAGIELGDTVAQVGQNNAGKSTVLRALNAFFNFGDEREDFELGRHANTKTPQALIEVTITGLKGAGLPTMRPGGDEVRTRLKFRKTAVSECSVGSKWQSTPPSLQEMLQYISFALVPVRRDHEVAHDPFEAFWHLLCSSSVGSSWRRPSATTT